MSFKLLQDKTETLLFKHTLNTPKTNRKNSPYVKVKKNWKELEETRMFLYCWVFLNSLRILFSPHISYVTLTERARSKKSINNTV